MSILHHKTIFVCIASYRDPDCINTVKSLLKNAANPERLTFGICWQYVPGEEPALLQLLKHQEQSKQISLPAMFSRGPCLARHLAQQLWQGEEYYFQIDSHMRFVPGWDEKLITLMHICPSPRPVLSTYPLAFTPPEEYADDALVRIMPRYFDEYGILHQHSALIAMPDHALKPETSFFVSAGMLFTYGRAISQVPYDPHIYFAGEEITLGIRLWTHGWDIFNPNAVLAYHNYQLQTRRKRHWEDQSDWTELQKVSAGRVRFLTGQTVNADAHCLTEMDKYGLGNIRTIREYEQATGLDFVARSWQGKELTRLQQSKA
ncbi:GlcNAc-transferase family protein [Desulfonatronovibrio magnus]|uniref:GlcNAc-transferase family protein n=1 Tax=Desulfonatronovibrio magnus TaxID=698827 RepID=UPI0005EB3175|nr:GlcNAc-transferase family protein [Desulfonatronovibrio magnus]